MIEERENEHYIMIEKVRKEVQIRVLDRNTSLEMRTGPKSKHLLLAVVRK